MSKIRELKDAVRGYFQGEVLDGVRDRIVMTLASDPRMQARWMSYCGAEDPSGIDYANPCVQIELMACDPSVLAIAEDAEGFIARTRCDRGVFMEHYWPGKAGS